MTGKRHKCGQQKSKGAAGRMSGNEADPDVQVVSGRHLWATKRASQARDKELVAEGKVPPEAMIFLRPELLQGAQIEWPDDDQCDDQ